MGKTYKFKSIGILVKARKSFNFSTLLTLYYSFIYPHFLYFIETWGKADNKYLYELVKTQKRVIRIITSSSFRTPMTPLY